MVDRALAVLGILFTLPGFLLLFLSESQSVGVAFTLTGFALLVTAFVYYYFRNLPAFTVKEQKVLVEIKDPQGKLSTVKRTYRVRSNYKHQSSMTHKNIASDGSVSNICWNGTPVPAAQIKQFLHEYIIQVPLDMPVKPFGEFSGTLSWDLADSFPGNPEGVIYCVDFPTKVVEIEILLPAARPALDATASRIDGIGYTPIDGLDRSPGGRRLAITLRRPKVNSEFLIGWHW
ncbi:MAG: hypothetical protein WC538_22705 [Thermoanaerobaculia bacterium]|jgi:hypothetical protein